MDSCVLMALIATLGTWFLTALGAMVVVFFKTPSDKIMNFLLGFAAGVMIAASFWSLLLPAQEKLGDAGNLGCLILAIGFLSGAVFIWAADKIISYTKKKFSTVHGAKNDKLNRIIMLVLSITLHNIPEGLAVGVAFGALSVLSPDAIMGAISVAVGIGLQNFPEGAAVSLPLRREGFSRRKSFFIGQASGMVEPIAGVLGAMLVVYMESFLPFALSFAAGAMILVSVHELIPECQEKKKLYPYFSTMGIISGFAVMMLLDVMLG